MAVWMNAAHRTMGGDVGERMEAGGWNNIHCPLRNGHQGGRLGLGGSTWLIVWCVVVRMRRQVQDYLHKNNKRKSMRVTPSKYNQVIFSFMLLCDVSDVLFFQWLYIDFLMWVSEKIDWTSVSDITCYFGRLDVQVCIGLDTEDLIHDVVFDVFLVGLCISDAR
jgi:hypothetical protein